MISAKERVLDDVNLMANVTHVVVAATEAGYTRDQLVTLVDACWAQLAASVEQAERIEYAEEARPAPAGDRP